MKLEKMISLPKEQQKAVKNAFLINHCNPVRERRDLPYLKYNLTDVISEVIIQKRDRGEKQNFSKNLYNTVNKDVLKRVNYGIRSIGHLPFEFIDCLSKWEAVYFFRGRWGIRNPNLDEPIHVITSKHLVEGVKGLYQDYYVRKARGEYSPMKEFPEDNQIKEQCLKIIGDYENKIIPKVQKKEESIQKENQLTLF